MESNPSYSSISDIATSRARSWHSFLHFRTIPGVKRLESLLSGMSPAERLLVYLLGLLLVISTAGILYSLSQTAMVEQPADGGSLIEGVVGTPRFINPLLANSDADRDLTSLIYSGLVRAMPDGSIIPDLAERYEISEDGTEYTFFLRPNARFHDDTRVMAADVIFTIEEAQNPDIKSPKRANWDGVEITAIDDLTIRFTLGRPYAPFLENATIGILPKHLWGEIAPDAFPFHQLNTHPIGSGPYRLRSVRTDTTGTPTEYILRSFSKFSLGAPHITTIDLKLYASEDALLSAYDSGAIASIAGITAHRVKELEVPTEQILTTPLPRVFAIFFNQNQQTMFLSETVREALDTALDKEAIIDAALGGYGTALTGPIPPNVMVTNTNSAVTASSTERIEKARTLLVKDGWKLDLDTGFFNKKDQELAFSISTADTPELVASANAAADMWHTLGANVTVKVFSAGSINTSVIRPRNYEALLFGEIVGRTLDLFAFWHSTQRNDPGLNLALYTNAKADTLLSEARAETDRKSREATLASFTTIVEDDHPAAFLYAPDFIYIIPAKLKGVALGALTTPSDRFLNVHEWHIETKSVWYIFSE